MSERKIKIPCENGIELEGLMDSGSTGRGVVAVHPHPLYGGDMTNNVVETIVGAYRKQRHATLRFNFRGVGASTGDHDDGIGEQADLLAAFQFLKGQGIESIDLAGYSFGAWVIAKAAGKIPADRIIMVAPPAAMMDFDENIRIPGLKLVITGSRDEFAPVDRIKELTAAWDPAAAFEVIDGADHFFLGYAQRLTEILCQYI
ncbi:MAG: alpha/beta fold hydrolase [Desulfosalsimonadaceae bacterium]